MVGEGGWRRMKEEERSWGKTSVFCLKNKQLVHLSFFAESGARLRSKLDDKLLKL